MIGRLVAALALLVSALVLGSASPAAACSCVRLSPGAYAERADFAFVGTTTRERATDDSAIYRFTVDTVYLGEVRRVQDVVTPRAPGDAVDSCEERLPEGSTRLVLGTVDDEGRLTFGQCQEPAWTPGEPFTDRIVAALGTGSAPVAGKDLVEIDRTTRDDLRWIGLGVGVIGLAGMGVLARRTWRARRPAA